VRRYTAALGFLCLQSLAFAQPSPQELIALASRNAPELRQALIAAFGEELRKGTAVAGYLGDFVWAIESTSRPALFVDDTARPAMHQIAGTNLWYALDKLVTGTSYRFHYVIDAKVFGGRTDVPAYGPDSYVQPGVPQGKLSERLTHTSRLYEGMTSNYWIYVPAQYDPKTPAALMVWQDGESFANRDGNRRLLNAADNLTHQKKIPVMIHVLVSPGTIGERRMRSILYDTVSDKYVRFLRDELLPEVYAKYNVRRDGYSRGIAGVSSGGICAFNAAWHAPEQFSRVLSWIGSFTSIQWDRQTGVGGHDYPFMVRKQPKRNIRVWLQEGSEDLENTHGSWPLQNIQLANSLKLREYDFHLSLGNGTHNSAHGSAELPAELAWLWRDYDPAKTEQTFTMDPIEQKKPLFRVRPYNRDISDSDRRP
jgi:enterochelin esterase family protein